MINKNFMHSNMTGATQVTGRTRKTPVSGLSRSTNDQTPCVSLDLSKVVAQAKDLKRRAQILRQYPGTIANHQEQTTKGNGKSVKTTQDNLNRTKIQTPDNTALETNDSPTDEGPSLGKHVQIMSVLHPTASGDTLQTMVKSSLHRKKWEKPSIQHQNLGKTAVKPDQASVSQTAQNRDNQAWGNKKIFSLYLNGDDDKLLTRYSEKETNDVLTAFKKPTDKNRGTDPISENKEHVVKQVPLSQSQKRATWESRKNTVPANLISSSIHLEAFDLQSEQSRTSFDMGVPETSFIDKKADTSLDFSVHDVLDSDQE